MCVKRLVWIIIGIFFVVAYPIGKLLDRCVPLLLYIFLKI